MERDRLGEANDDLVINFRSNPGAYRPTDFAWVQAFRAFCRISLPDSELEGYFVPRERDPFDPTIIRNLTVVPSKKYTTSALNSNPKWQNVVTVSAEVLHPETNTWKSVSQIWFPFDLYDFVELVPLSERDAPRLGGDRHAGSLTGQEPMLSQSHTSAE